LYANRFFGQLFLLGVLLAEAVGQG